jgi:Uma2 family endonuclease
MASDPRPYFTLEQYLELERSSLSGERHEYIDGQIFPVPHGTINHSRINGKLFRRVGNKLEQARSSCAAFSQDLLVQAGQQCVYPDLAIVCGEIQSVKKDEVVLNPLLIGEILSPTTEDYDRGRKFSYYRAIASLREYLIVAQHEILIEQWIGGSGKPWQLIAEHRDPLSSFSLVCLPEIDLSITELYDGVTWPSAG